MVSVIRGQPQSENVPWKFPELDNSWVLIDWALSNVGWWHLAPSLTIPRWLVPISSLRLLSAHSSLSSCVDYHTDCRGVAEPVFTSPPLYLLIAPKHKNSDARNLDTPKRSWKVKSSFRWKVNFLNFIRKEKLHVQRLLRSALRTNLLSVKSWRRTFSVRQTL